MPKAKLPKGVHRVRRKVLSGVKYHFYAWRGKPGESPPKFWEDTVPFPTDPAFFHAYSDCTKRPAVNVLLTERLVDDFLSSASMPRGERSKQDIRKWALRFAMEFGADPAAMFEERASRGELNKWRAKWQHSPKQHDAAGTHAVRVLNWAVGEGRLSEHHCHKLKRLYKSNRSEIIWTIEDRRAFAARAPNWVVRILEVGCETGLRPADLVLLDFEKHIEVTPTGRRLRVRTAKSNRDAYIPVTERLAELIDKTPQGQRFLLVGERGGQISKSWASQRITFWRREADVSRAEDGREKTLSDTRGTAATKLLNADLSLAEIATYMGWSIRYAANVIEHYARVSPSETDAVLAKLNEAKRREDKRKL